MNNVTSAAREPLKIACIGTRGLPSNYSGLESACEGLYSALAARGHIITVYCRPRSAGDGSHVFRGIHLRTTQAIQSKKLETLSHVATSVVHALYRGDYDLIHLHALAPGIFSRLCRTSGIPTVSTVHGLDWQRDKWKGLGAKALKFGEISMVRNVDEILVVSRDLQKYYADRYGRATIYIPNGVEQVHEAEYERSTILQDAALTSRNYILYLGRLVPEKRIEDLILAYRDIKNNCKLVVAGESDATDSYSVRLRRLAAEDGRVLFLGLQDKAAVHHLLHHAAVFAAPSALEGLPMSLLECMQHGTPAVVSDIPPHRELLGTISGYDLFFPPTNVEALKIQLERALARQAEYRLVAEDGCCITMKSHSWPNIAERTEAALYGVLDRCARNPRTEWALSRSA